MFKLPQAAAPKKPKAAGAAAFGRGSFGNTQNDSYQGWCSQLQTKLAQRESYRSQCGPPEDDCRGGGGGGGGGGVGGGGEDEDEEARVKALVVGRGHVAVALLSNGHVARCELRADTHAALPREENAAPAAKPACELAWQKKFSRNGKGFWRRPDPNDPSKFEVSMKDPKFGVKGSIAAPAAHAGSAHSGTGRARSGLGVPNKPSATSGDAVSLPNKTGFGFGSKSGAAPAAAPAKPAFGGKKTGFGFPTKAVPARVPRGSASAASVASFLSVPHGAASVAPPKARALPPTAPFAFGKPAAGKFAFGSGAARREQNLRPALCGAHA